MKDCGTYSLEKVQEHYQALRAEGPDTHGLIAVKVVAIRNLEYRNPRFGLDNIGTDYCFH
jgi:hypothetical protein